MTRISMLIGCLCFCITTFTFAAGGDLGLSKGANGTDTAPWLIEDFDDFQAFCNDTSKWSGGVYTRLEADLDLDPALPGRAVYIKAPIAGDADESNFYDGISYAGVFDGSGHVISNCQIDGGDYCGLFGRIVSGSEISNVRVENAAVTGSGEYIGGLAGENNYGSVSSCYFTGSTHGFIGTGGLVGRNYGSVIDCFSSGSVQSSFMAGGLLGLNSGNVSSSNSSCDVSGADVVGGLVGKNFADISECYSSGSVIGSGDYAGGLVGVNDSGNISVCYSSGSVQGVNQVGGLVGGNSGTVSNCYSTSSSDGSDDVGGLVGENYFGTVSYCYSTGIVSENGVYGGLVGINSGSVSNSFWDIDSSGILDPEAGVSDTDGMIGKTTAELQTESTFTEAGWDFVVETVNGSEDLWRMPYLMPGYPILSWQKDIPGDFAGDYCVDLFDAEVLSADWLNVYDFSDLIDLTANWLAGK